VSIAFAIVAAAQALTSGQLAIKSYQDCIAPVVTANNRVAEKDYLSLDPLLAKVKRDCASERLAARDALSAYVATEIMAREQRTVPADDGWKEDLIDEATVRWMNSVSSADAVNISGQR